MGIKTDQIESTNHDNNLIIDKVCEKICKRANRAKKLIFIFSLNIFFWQDFQELWFWQEFQEQWILYF